MPKRCGDKTSFKYKVTSELVDKYVTLLICRKKKFDFAGVFTEKIKKEETKKIKWPDQEIKDKENEFYGGRKVDYKGLNKLSYKDKFAHQEFEINLYQGPHKKRSAKATLKIEHYPDVGREQKTVGIPMPTQHWEGAWVRDFRTGAQRLLYTLESPYGTSANDNCGNYWTEIKDGVCVITIKLRLFKAGTRQEEDPKVFKYIKKRAEAFWNSNSTGYNQWYHHRNDCARGDECNCSVVVGTDGNYKDAGCCKIPIKVVIEAGSDNTVEIERLTPTQREEAARNALGLNEWGATGTRANTMKFYYPENRANTYAHEIGHMMGFPDQYPSGAVASGAMSITGPVAGAAWPIDDRSVMGVSQGKAMKIHTAAEWVSNWIKDKAGESFKVISNE